VRGETVESTPTEPGGHGTPAATGDDKQAGIRLTDKRIERSAEPGGPAPARSSSPACSPRPPSTSRPVRDPDSTSYLGSFAPAEHFALLVAAAAPMTSADIRQLVVLDDGAPWIWTLATANWPEATPIVDIYHARQHLHDLAAGLAPVPGDALPRLAGRPAGRPGCRRDRNPGHRNPPAAPARPHRR
jgi:hypothetical protein